MHVASMFTCHPFFISKPAYHTQNELDLSNQSVQKLHIKPTWHPFYSSEWFSLYVYAYISSCRNHFPFYGRKLCSFASISDISKGERTNLTGETCLLICNPLVPHEETTAKHWPFSMSLSRPAIYLN